jgi:hypothetical protein
VWRPKQQTGNRVAKKAFALRIDEAMLQALQQWADDEFRSVNGQIEYVLREALLKSGRVKRSEPVVTPLPEQPD